MPERSSDWFKQAVRDLASAKAQSKDGFFGWASGIPSEYINRKDAQDAIGNSKKILQFCKGILAK